MVLSVRVCCCRQKKNIVIWYCQSAFESHNPQSCRSQEVVLELKQVLNKIYGTEARINLYTHFEMSCFVLHALGRPFRLCVNKESINQSTVLVIQVNFGLPLQDLCLFALVQWQMQAPRRTVMDIK